MMMFKNKDTLNLKRLKKGGGMEKVLQLGPLFSLVKKIYKKKSSLRPQNQCSGGHILKLN